MALQAPTEVSRAMATIGGCMMLLGIGVRHTFDGIQAVP
jgi:hypothetical protein